MFHAIVSLYGHENITKAQGILLNIENYKKEGFIFFDSMQDEEMRGGEKRYMLGLVAPKINYFDSLKINEKFIEISQKIKQNTAWNVKKHWEDLSSILSGDYSV